MNIVEAFDELIGKCSYLIFGWEVTICIIIALVLAFVSGLVVRNKRFSDLSIKIFGKTVNKGIWRDIIDFELGTTAFVYLKNRSIRYTGFIDFIEEDNERPWISLTNFICIDDEKGEKFCSSDVEGRLMAVTINLEDVDRIELLYDEKTRILDRLK